jgi:hypothetical protein
MVMKRVAVYIAMFFLLPAGVCLAKNIGFEATVARTRISAGQSIQMNLTFNNTQNIPALDLPQLDGFTSRYAGPSSSMSIINGAVSSSITHMYILQSLKAGKFTLGPFEFEHNGDTYSSNRITIEVSAGAAQPQPDTQPQDQPAALSQDISDRVYAVLESPKKNMYVNETVPLTVKLYVNHLSIRDIQFPEIQHEGISVGQFSQPKQYQDVVGGIMYDVIEFDTTMFGLKPGEVTVGPANLKCNLVVRKQSRRQPSAGDFFDSNVFDDFFGRYEAHPLTLNSRSLPVKILPLPEEGRPAGFSGALGAFSFDVSVSPADVNVGDPVTVKATVKGNGNFSTITIPKIETAKDIKAYEPQIKQEEGKKTFEQVVMPMRADIKELPAVAFSFFNTDTGAYETITRGPFAINVAKPDREEQAKLIEGRQAQAIQVPQEEKFGRDIIYIKEADGGLGRKAEPLYMNTAFRVVQAAALFLYLCVLGFYAWSRRLRADIRYARKLQAPGKARAGIAAANRLAKGNKPGEFYDVLFDTLQGYLGDRFHLASKSITAGIIDDILKPRNVSAEIQEKLSGLFRDCDMARYAPAGFAADQMQKALSDLEDVIDYLQRNKV